MDKLLILPTCFTEQNVPKVRWMYVGEVYKARFMEVPINTPEGVLYIYIINRVYCIAYLDAALTQEIGMLKVSAFIKVEHIAIEQAPAFSSKGPISLTYGQLLEKIKNPSIEITTLEPASPAAESTQQTVTKILPPEPEENFIQLNLFTVNL